MIESGLRAAAVLAHVPFADERGLIAALLQILRKEHGPWRDWRVVVHDMVLMRVQPRQNGCAAGRAERRRHEGVLEVHAAVRDRVDVRSLDDRIPHESQRVVPVIVGKDEDDIARLDACETRQQLNCPRRLRQTGSGVSEGHHSTDGQCCYDCGPRKRRHGAPWVGGLAACRLRSAVYSLRWAALWSAH